MNKQNPFASIIARVLPDNTGVLLVTTDVTLWDFFEDSQFNSWLHEVVKADRVKMRGDDMLLIPALQQLGTSWRLQSEDYITLLEINSDWIDKLATLGLGIDVLGHPDAERRYTGGNSDE